MWQIYAIISAIGWGLINIISKKVMRDTKSTVFNTIFNLVGGAFFLIFINKFELPTNPLGIILALLSSVLWSMSLYFEMNSYKYLDVSLIAPLSSLVPVTILISSVLLLGESFTLNKIIGTIIIIIGSIIITFNSKKKYKISTHGLVLFGLFITNLTFANIVDKVAIEYFNVFTYGFLLYFIPGLIFLPFGLKEGIKKIKKLNFWLIILCSFIGFVCYAFSLSAYKLTEISNIAPIGNLKIIVAMIGGFLFFKEKGILRKTISALIMIIGVLFII